MAETPNKAGGAGLFAKQVQKRFMRAQEKDCLGRAGKKPEDRDLRRPEDVKSALSNARIINIGINKTITKRIIKVETTSGQVFQKIGKTVETKDEQFEQCCNNFTKQQNDGNRLFKDLKSYINAVKVMHETAKRLSETLEEVYESEWQGKEQLHEILENSDLLWADYGEKLSDQALRTMESYMSQFPEFKKRVAKRGRKLVDYDSSRHHLEALQSAKKKDETKITKAEEEFVDAQNGFEELNTQLREELPVLWSSRIGCYVTIFQNMSNLRDMFYKEMSKLNQEMYILMTKLEKEHSNKIFIVKGLSSKRRSLIISSPVKTVHRLSSSSESSSDQASSASPAPSVKSEALPPATPCDLPATPALEATPELMESNQEPPSTVEAPLSTDLPLFTDLPLSTSLAPLPTSLAPLPTSLAPLSTSLAPLSTSLAPLPTSLAPLPTQALPGSAEPFTPPPSSSSSSSVSGGDASSSETPQVESSGLGRDGPGEESASRPPPSEQTLVDLVDGASLSSLFPAASLNASDTQPTNAPTGDLLSLSSSEESSADSPVDSPQGLSTGGLSLPVTPNQPESEVSHSPTDLDSSKEHPSDRLALPVECASPDIARLESPFRVSADVLSNGRPTSEEHWQFTSPTPSVSQPDSQSDPRDSLASADVLSQLAQLPSEALEVCGEVPASQGDASPSVARPRSEPAPTHVSPQPPTQEPPVTLHAGEECDVKSSEDEDAEGSDSDRSSAEELPLTVNEGDTVVYNV